MSMTPEQIQSAAQELFDLDQQSALLSSGSPATEFTAPEVQINGTRLSDYGKLAGAGTADTVGALAWVADQLTGGSFAFTGDLQQFTNDVSQAFVNNTTPAMQAALSKKFVEENGDSWAMGDAWTDPAAILGTIVRSAPGMVGGMGAASITAKGSRALAKSLGYGAKAQQKATRAGAVAGGGAFEGAVAGGSVGQEIEKMVMDAPLSQLAKHSEAFQRAYDETNDVNKARRAVAKEASQAGAAGAGAVTALLGAPFNDLIGRVYAGQAGSRLANGVRGAVTEMPTEALQSGGEAFAKEYAGHEELGREISGVNIANEMAAGAAAGGAMGGGVGLMGRISDTAEPPPPTPPDMEVVDQSVSPDGGAMPESVEGSDPELVVVDQSQAEPAVGTTDAAMSPLPPQSERLPEPATPPEPMDGQVDLAQAESAPAPAPTPTPTPTPLSQSPGDKPYYQPNPETGELQLSKAALWDYVDSMALPEQARQYRQANERRMAAKGQLSEEDAFLLAALETKFLRTEAQRDAKAAGNKLLRNLTHSQTVNKQKVIDAFQLEPNTKKGDIDLAAQAVARGDKLADVPEHVQPLYKTLAVAWRNSLPQPSVTPNQQPSTESSPVSDMAVTERMPETQRLQQEADKARQVLDGAAAEVNTSPTEAQKKAGNYRKQRLRYQGMTLVIENPKGSTRSGTDPNGSEWSNTMAAHYGDIKNTTGADGDNLDVFMGDALDTDRVFIINQSNAEGGFDEHKIMLGFNSETAAREAYLASYGKDWQGLGSIHSASLADFKDWIKYGNHTQPYQSQAQTPQEAQQPPSPEPQTNTELTDSERESQAVEAMRQVVRTHEDVVAAVSRPDLGDIDFIYGEEGKAPNARGVRKGAKGVAHILEARKRKDGLSDAQAEALAEDVAKVVATAPVIASRTDAGSEVIRVGDGQHTAVLVKNQDDNHWLLTGWENVVEDGERSKGYDKSAPTHGGTTLTRPNMGASSTPDKVATPSSADKPTTKQQRHSLLISDVEAAARQLAAPGADKNKLRKTIMAKLRKAYAADDVATMAAIARIDQALKRDLGQSFEAIAGKRTRLAELIKTYSADIDQDTGQESGPAVDQAEPESGKSAPADGQEVVNTGTSLPEKASDAGELDQLNGKDAPAPTSPELDKKSEAAPAAVDNDISTAEDAPASELERVESNDAPATSNNLEPDTPAEQPKKRVGESDVRPGRAKPESGTGQASREADRELSEQGDSGLSDSAAVAGGTASADRVHRDDGRARIEKGLARGTEPERSGAADDARVQPEQRTAETTAPAAGGLNLDERIAAQAAAKDLPVVIADDKNISDTLPLLYPEQHTDVYKIERRLFADDQPGILVTNGTGTGKTFTGMGTIFRAVQRGQSRILVVTPSQTKVTDWIEEAGRFDLDLQRLKSTRDAGKDLVITTYANMRDNPKVMAEFWDLVVYDESHRILEDKNGSGGSTLKAHYTITARDDFYTGSRKARAEMHEQFEALNAKIEQRAQELEGGDLNAERALAAAREEFSEESQALYAKAEQRGKALLQERGDQQTKVLFLSTTPFASHKAMVYARGYVFDVEAVRSNKDEQATGYNQATGFDAFLASNLGYRMRVGKLTQPGPDVNVPALEIELADSLAKSGAMFGRQLKVERDYSREFVREDNDFAELIDRTIYDVLNHKDYPLLHGILSKRLDHNTRKRLVEAVNAAHAAERAAKHLELGRKVVIFHDLNQVDLPGLFSFRRHLKNDNSESDDKLRAEIERFESQHPRSAGLGLAGMMSVPDTIKSVFGDRAALFRGDVPTAERARVKKAFNDPSSGLDVIVIQRQAGKEGISLHDISGDAQRALLLATIPVQATDLTQIEGRIYRLGVQSDAVIEILSTGVRFESWAWGSAVSQMTATAENLAFGSAARDIAEVLRDGYVDYTTADPHLGQGKGGRGSDGQVQALNAFDKAINEYNRRQKRTQRDKSKEGKDYFATPEPLGLAMVRWAHQRDGDSNLEPSGGHGAIARWFNPVGHNRAIEQSSQLASQLRVVFGGDVVNGSFESLNAVNKFDTIVMNPPFGRGGSTAYQHLEKALGHLRDGGRVVAIVPDGPAANKRLDKLLDQAWFDSEYQWTADIKLPGVTFDQAATNVATRILVIDRYKHIQDRLDAAKVQQDLTAIDNVKELFERVRDMSIPERNEVSEPSNNDFAPDGFEISQFANTKTGDLEFRAAVSVELTQPQFKTARSIAKEFGGRYSRFRGGDAQPGFLFPDADKRASFMVALMDTYPEQFDSAEPAPAAMEPNLEVPASLQRKQSAPMISEAKLKRAIARIAKKYRGIHVDDIVVAENQSETYRRAYGREQEPGTVFAGVYDSRNVLGQGRGKIWLNRDALRDEGDVEAVIRHELLIHKGLGMYSPESVAALMDKIADNAEKKDSVLHERWQEIKETYQGVAARAPEWVARRYYAEELLAHHAEKKTSGLVKWMRMARRYLAAFVRKESAFPERWNFEDIDSVVWGIEKHLKQRGIPRVRDTNELGHVTDFHDYAGLQIPARMTRSESSRRLSLLGRAIKGASQRTGDITADTRKHWLGGLTRRHLADYASDIPFVKHYVNLGQHMDSYRNELLVDAGELVERWTNWQRKNRAESKKLSKMMHQATVWSVDPSEAFKPLIEPKEAKERIEELTRKAKALGRRGKIKGEQSQAAAFAEIEEIKLMLHRDKRRKDRHARLRHEYNQLSAQAQGYFTEVRDFYEQRHEDTLKELEAVIGRNVADGKSAAALTAQVRAEFEANKVEGPYFPLGRQGNYFGYAEKETTQETQNINAAHSLANKLISEGHAAIVIEGSTPKVVATYKEFRLFETQSEQRQWSDDMQQQGFNVRTGKQLSDLREVDGVNPEFMAKVEDLLDALGDSPVVRETRDGIYQMYLQTLPQLSARKNFIHRKKTPGYDEDAARTFAANAFHGSYQLARLRYSDQLQGILRQFKNAMQDTDREAFQQEYSRTQEALALSGSGKKAVEAAWKEWTEETHGSAELTEAQTERGAMLRLARKMLNDRTYRERLAVTIEQRQQNAQDMSDVDMNKAADVYGELLQRHDWAMNPKGSAWANWATSLGFFWYLGVSPAAALVNVTQTPLVALPLMAQKFGWGASAKALLKGTSDFMAGGVQKPSNGQILPGMSSVLEGEELDALNEGFKTGVLDKTLAHDLASVSQDGSDYNHTLTRVNRAVGWAFHNAERVNREATYMAAYRLARKRGMAHEKAIELAHDLTWESHFDYGSANKARFMQGDIQKVVLMFRQFSLNMTYLLGRNLHQALKGESADVKKAARQRLTGILGMHGLMAGAVGLPLYGVVTSILNLLFDDEDEPWDADVAFRNAMHDYFGPAGSWVVSGPVNALTGADVASRVSLDGLWWRGSNYDEEGREAAESIAVSILGPMFGIVKSGFEGQELMRQGELHKASEKFVPKFVRDPLRAIRYGSEGATNRRGDPVMEDFSAWELLLQANGLTPADLTMQYERNSALKNMESRIMKRRKLLMNRYWMAWRLNDSAGLRELQTDIERFNRANEAYPITEKTLKRSLKTRQRYSAQSLAGISLNKNLRHLTEEVRY